MTDRDEFVSASELARMGYCERQWGLPQDVCSEE